MVQEEEQKQHFFTLWKSERAGKKEELQKYYHRFSIPILDTDTACFFTLYLLNFETNFIKCKLKLN